MMLSCLGLRPKRGSGYFWPVQDLSSYKCLAPIYGHTRLIIYHFVKSTAILFSLYTDIVVHRLIIYHFLRSRAILIVLSLEFFLWHIETDIYVHR